MPLKDPVERKKYQINYYNSNKEYYSNLNKVRLRIGGDELRRKMNAQAKERYKNKFINKGTTKYTENIKGMTDQEYLDYREKKNIISKRYYRENREKIISLNKKNYIRIFLRKYGLTEELYFKILKDQNYVCAICLMKNTAKLNNKLPLLLDHCHKRKKFRGLLCSQCNIMLGMAKDNIEVLLKGIDYLKKYEENI